MEPVRGMPKVVWTLWLQGWDAAPPLVVACHDSWSERNPGWEVRALDAETIRPLLPELADQGDLSAAAYSDRVRLKLLARHGGVWVDATTYCHQPLDEWLPARLDSGFFAFSAPAPGRKVSSWFLASTPASLIVSRWDAAADAYWSGRTRPDSYFWLHELFGDLCRKDEEFSRDWRRTPSLRADGPHYFVPYRRRLIRPMTRRMRTRLASRSDPVYKLTHRVSQPVRPGSALAYFLEGAPILERGDERLATVDRNLEVVRWLGRDLANLAESGAKGALRRTAGGRRLIARRSTRAGGSSRGQETLPS